MVEKINIKRLLIITAVIIILAGILVSGWFVFRYLFPSNKELLLLANVNTYNYAQEKDDLGSFTKKTDISFATDGDFTSSTATGAFDTIKISFSNEVKDEEMSKYDVAIDFMGNSFFDCETIKNVDVEVLSAPQLADKSYAADSYSEVLSLLLGSEKPQEIDLYDGIDKEGLKERYGEYLKRVYINIPDGDAILSKNGGKKNIELKTDLNRLLFEVLTDIKNNLELIDFTYDQKAILYENINKKFPYAGTLLTIESKDEFREKFVESIDVFMKDTEESVVVICAEIEKRKIIRESIEIKNNTEQQFYAEYSKDSINVVKFDKGKTFFELNTSNVTEDGKSFKKTVVAVDVNDMTKEKSQEQKIVTITFETEIDTTYVPDIRMPVDYEDIRLMSPEEKESITQTASKKFMELIAVMMLEMF